MSKFSLNVHNKNEFIGGIFKIFLTVHMCTPVCLRAGLHGVQLSSLIAAVQATWSDEIWKKTQRLYKLARYHWAEDGEGKQQLELGFCTRNNIMYTAKINKRTLIYVHEHQLKGEEVEDCIVTTKKKATNNGAAACAHICCCTSNVYDREKKRSKCAKIVYLSHRHTRRRPSKDTR